MVGLIVDKLTENVTIRGSFIVRYIDRTKSLSNGWQNGMAQNRIPCAKTRTTRPSPQPGCQNRLFPFTNYRTTIANDYK